MQDHGRIGTKTKPFIIAPILSPGFKKVIDPELLLEKYEGRTAKASSVFAEGIKTLTKELKEAKSAEATIKNMRQVSKALGVNELIAQNVLSDIEFSTNSKFNKEILMNEQLFRDYLKKQLTLNNVFAMEEALDEYSTEEVEEKLDDFIDSGQVLAANQTTIAHDINFYSGRANIFKKQERWGYNYFNTSEYTSALNEQSMSPKSILQKLNSKFWENITNVMGKIKSTELSISSEALEDIGSEFIDGKNRDLNWENAPDAYTDNQAKTFEINANSQAILQAGFWENFNSEEFFSFIQFYWESGQRSSDAMREWIGDAKDQSRVLPVGEGAAVLSESVQEKIHKDNKKRVVRAKNKIERKWIEESPFLSPVELLNASIVAELMPEASKKLEILNNVGRNNGQKEKNKFFYETLKGYLKHSLETYISPHFKIKKRFDESKLGRKSLEELPQLVPHLKQYNILTKDGELNQGINPFDSSFVLDSITDNKEVADDIMMELQDISIGQYSLYAEDNKLNHDKPRRLFKVKGSDNKLRSVSEILELINMKDSPDDTLDNLRLAYDHLMNIHSAMTGITLKSQGKNGGLVFEKDDQDSILVKVSDHAQWQEWHRDEEALNGLNGEEEKGAYKTVAEQPLFIHFKSLDKATRFKESTRQLIALLEPILGVFPNHKNPLNILVDNSGSSDAVDMIVEGKQGYELRMDTAFQASFFNSKEYASLKKDISYKVSMKVMTKLFSDSIKNRMIRMKWKRDWKDYKEEQDKFKKEKQEEEKQDRKARAKVRAEMKRMKQALENAYKKRKAEEKRNKNKK